MNFKDIFIIFICTLAFVACKNEVKKNQSAEPSSTAAATPPAVAKKKIIFFGNSLTAGYGLSPEQAFSNLIQHQIDSLTLPYTCVNAGNSGETTAGGVTRIDWILQQPIDLFVLELGGNDALRGIPVATSAQNLQIIIDKVRKKYPNCAIVLAGMMAPPNLGATYTKAFHQMYLDLATKNKLALVPFLLEGVGGKPALNQSDGIHPTAEGHKILADNVWRILKPLL